MKCFSGIAAAGLLVVLSQSYAADYAQIEERLGTLVPDVSDITIAETPLPGLMEVRIRNEVIYMSSDGRYLVQGRMVDLETQIDLTDSAKAEVRRERLSNLDQDEFVTFGNDDAEFELMVFTDPDCGYCRRLHEQMRDYNREGIRIHYMAFPRAGVGSDTYDKLVSIWCSNDRQHAMDIAKAGGAPDPETCDNPVTEQYELGQSLGVTGTPSMMTFDGEMIPGYVPPQQLRERLERLNGNTRQ